VTNLGNKLILIDTGKYDRQSILPILYDLDDLVVQDIVFATYLADADRPATETWPVHNSINQVRSLPTRVDLVAP
jgi:hypothetical protein